MPSSSIVSFTIFSMKLQRDLDRGRMTVVDRVGDRLLCDVIEMRGHSRFDFDGITTRREVQLTPCTAPSRATSSSSAGDEAV